MAGVRSGVGSQKRAAKAAGNQLTQRLLVDIALQNRQTVKMGTHAANQHVITVKHQMLWRNGRGQQFVTVANVFGGIFGGDMFEHHFQAR